MKYIVDIINKYFINFNILLKEKIVAIPYSYSFFKLNTEWAYSD